MAFSSATRRLLFSQSRALVRGRAPREVGAASSTAVSTSISITTHTGDVAWETALQDFFHTLARTSEAAVVSALFTTACTTMQACVRYGRVQEALDVYTALCRSGVTPDTTPEELQAAARLEEIALHTLRTLPYRAHQSQVVELLLSAETETPHHGLHSSFAHASSASHWESEGTRVVPRDLRTAEALSEVEQFRISLQQQRQLLRTTGYAQQPLGRNHALTSIYHVLDRPKLCSGVEVQPLLQLSSTVLWHPFAYEVPTLKWAQDLLCFDDLGLPVFAADCSQTQQEGLAQIEESIAPLRTSCPQPLRFLARLAPNWDAVVVRRVAETLVLPEEAHNIFPPAHSLRRRRLADRTSGATTTTADQSPWTDPTSDLFPSPSAAISGHPLVEAAQRVEAILKRRVYHDIIVPDIGFVMKHFHLLLQLSKYREIVVPHGVFIELATIASQSQDPRRFRARGALRSLMEATTTATTASESGSELLKDRSSVSARARKRSGVTLLGLQDELALLNNCAERFFVGEAAAGTAATWAADPLLSGQRCEIDGLTAGGVSALMVAKQLERLVSLHDRGALFASPGEAAADGGTSSTPPPPPSMETDMDSIIAGILETHDAIEHAPAHSHRSTPLFKSRSRGFWARMPVVLASVTEQTRALAYMVNIKLYPPASSA